MRIFLAYRDSPERRRALTAPIGSRERYRLYGLDELSERGHAVRHNLERPGSPAWARAVGGGSKALLERAGGYGGDFATVLASVSEANGSDVVLSTVDTVGIPLVLARRARLLRAPLVYTAIGLPERLARLGSDRMRRLYAAALARCESVVAYSASEADELRAFIEATGERARVEFVPFGVDERAFAPSLAPSVVDVVMVGADPHRDVDLFVGMAERRASHSFRLVTTTDRVRTLAAQPDNLQIETDLSLDDVKARLDEARLVALPVVDNSYSGATTVLLQAMALGKPVVVTRTRAISRGYGLADGENCRLVEPDDPDAFERAVDEVLEDESHARSLGARARETVESGLTWDRYVERIEAIVAASASGRS